LLDVKEGVAQAYELDDTKISQILGNLISNAIKFTDVGSVTLSVEKIKTLKTTDILRFKVIDTGVGIGENNFEEIFESFSQPKSITTKKHGGSGLGLAIVKKLVELHDSTIHVESKIGKGSAFYFDIEFKRTRLKKVVVAETPHLLTGKTVLLAEDKKVNAMEATKLLSNWGLVIELAENGLVATEKAGDKKYDFILMDIHMPEMNGYDATLQIRNTINPNTQTPIFALTADTTVSTQQEYINYFTSVLQKPIDIDKLQKALTYL
jgi:CheY-like chemotaxis protein